MKVLLSFFFVGTMHRIMTDDICKGLIKIQNTSADYILGGLFPAHYYDYHLKKYQFNLQAVGWIEAMIYSIQEINNNRDLLPNHTLGYQIFDTCNTVRLATEATLYMLLESDVKNNWKHQREDTCCLRNGTSVTAIVGDASSAVATSVATILSVDKIPAISYSATSPALQDKTIYPSFLRTIPSDHFQADVIADLLLHFNWTYVVVLASDDEYGRAGTSYLLPKLKDVGTCLSHFNIISLTATEQELVSIIRSIKEDLLSSVIILWCERPMAYAILKTSERNMLYDRVWIATETWSSYDKLLEFHPRVVSGLIGISPYNGHSNYFHAYLKSKNPCDHHSNIWLSVVVKKYFKIDCTVTRPFDRVNGNSSLWDILPRNKVGNVIDAVKAIASALHESKLSHTKSTHGPLFLSTLKKVNFPGYNGYNVSFDQNGDLQAGAYSINSIKECVDGTLKFESVAIWDTSEKKITLKYKARFYWPRNNTLPPRSKCADSCGKGHYTLPNPRRPCCWECLPCPTGTVQDKNVATQCKICGKTQVTDVNKTVCIKLSASSFPLASVAGMALSITSCGGIILSIVIIVIIIKARTVTIIRSSNVKLSLIQLVTVSLLYGFPFLLILKPSPVLCATKVFFVGSLSILSISTTLTKTEKLIRIFRARHRFSKRNIRHENRVEYITIISLIMPQIITIALYFTWYPPQVTSTIIADTITYECADHNFTFLLMSGYILLMATLCGSLGFRARNLPSFYNEAKDVALSMFIYSLCWSSYVAIHLSVQSSQDHEIVLGFVIVVANTNILVTLYFPKLYFLLKQSSEISPGACFTQERHFSVASGLSHTAAKGNWRSAMAGIKAMPHTKIVSSSQHQNKVHSR